MTEERENMKVVPYASAIGSIMYAMLCTRPDIAHAVSLTSRYQSDPGMEHWTAVKNILKYLKRTKDMFLCYGGDQELVVSGYTDASWNTDPDDSKCNTPNFNKKKVREFQKAKFQTNKNFLICI